MSISNVIRSLANTLQQKQRQQKQVANSRYVHNGQPVNFRQLPIETRREISRKENILNIHKQPNAHNFIKRKVK